MKDHLPSGELKILRQKSLNRKYTYVFNKHLKKINCRPQEVPELENCTFLKAMFCIKLNQCLSTLTESTSSHTKYLIY